MNKAGERLINGLAKENPTFVLMLGMCPTLAVTTSAMNGLGMGLTTMVVLALSNLIISLLRKIIPNRVRIPAFIVIIASFVTAVQLLLEGYLPDLNKSLGVYIPLIVVNCIILGRAESYAYSNPPVASLFDGIGMGLGFTVALTCIGAVRELLGAGELFGASVMPASFVPIRIFGQAPGAFFVLAALVAIQNLVKESLKKRGKPYEKIGSGCSEDCMNCSDTGCARRFYDNTEEKASDAALEAAVVLKEKGETQKEKGETQKEKGEAQKEKGETQKEKGEAQKEKGETSKEKGETSKEKGETQKEKGKASKDKEEISKEKGETLKDSVETPKDDIENFTGDEIENNKEREANKRKDTDGKVISEGNTTKKRKSSKKNHQNNVKDKTVEKEEKPGGNTVSEEDNSNVSEEKVNDQKPVDQKREDQKTEDQKTEDQETEDQDRDTQIEDSKVSGGKKASPKRKRSNRQSANKASGSTVKTADAAEEIKRFIPIEEDEDLEILDLKEEE